MWKGRPSTLMLPGPIASSARSIRPSRPSALSARLTISRLGAAIGEASRISRAMDISSRCGLSAQTVANALAVERLMPA